MSLSPSKIRSLQVSTRVRSIVIAGLMMGFSYFLWRPSGPGVLAGGMALFAVGLVIQLVVLVATALVKRYIGDAELVAQSNYIIELVADAFTVLFFVIGTLRAFGASTDAL